MPASGGSVILAIRNSGKYLCVIAGPTAAGKTDLAIRIAQHFKTEIISADSRQFYREMNIGTAKPDHEQLSAVPHHMINNKSIDTLYGAGHFAADALQLLDDLFRSHNMVVVVGGSGLYIQALLYGIDEFESVPLEVRTELNRQYKEKGLEWLRQEVRKADPVFFEKADQNNPQRLLRALEVFVHTGEPISGKHSASVASRPFEVVKILLDPPRKELYDRIEKRVDMMMAQGLLTEARALYPHRHHNALRTVGYRELFDHLEGKMELDEAVKKIKQHTRNYAKRQLTWFRNRDTFTPFRPDQEQEIIKYVQNSIGDRSRLQRNGNE